MRRLFASVVVVVVVLVRWAPSASAACPVNSPVDCGSFCCPTAYGHCCSSQCGASANCGAGQDAAPPVLTCQPNQAQIVANCGGDVCGCSDACGKNIDCGSGCCNRGRCVNACVCTGGPSVAGWSLCGSSVGPSKSSNGCDVGESGGGQLALPLGIAFVSLLRLAKRRPHPSRRS